MKTVTVEIRGTSSLLQHRFDEKAESQTKRSSRKILLKQEEPRDAAKRVVYQSSDGTYFFPSTWITGTLSGAGSNYKQTGSRKSLRFLVPTAIVPVGDTVMILNGSGPAKDFEVDSRPVTIPATKGRIMRHRPRFDQWGARFSLRINDDILPVETAHQLLTDAGVGVGIGDYRPAKGGPFGTFRVTHWEEQE